MNDVPSELPDRNQSKPWGFWTTIGFGLIIALVFVVIQIVCVMIIVIYMKTQNPEMDLDAYAKTIESNGLAIALSTLVTAPCIIGLILFFAWLKKGISIQEYFSINRIKSHTVLKWVGIFILCVACSDLITFASGHDIVPKWAIDAYKTAEFVPLFWLAMIIGAPLYEEVFFRGFLFKGLQHSKAGPIWAIIITSLIWSSIHTQYEMFYIVVIFIFGLLLGFVRLKTDSILIPIGLHSLMNFIATIQTVIYMNYLL